MEEMRSKERPIPETVIREKETAHEEAVRANAIFDALLERRANWYQKYRSSLEVVPEVKPQIAKRYKRQAVRLIEAVEKQGDFIQELKEKGYQVRGEKGYGKSTIKRWEKRIDLASQVLQEKFEGQGVALAGGKAPAEKDKIPLEKWGFGDLLTSLEETEQEIVKTKNIYDQKNDELSKITQQDLLQGKSAAESRKEHQEFFETVETLRTKFSDLKLHKAEVEDQIYSRTDWEWTVARIVLNEEQPSWMGDEMWEDEKRQWQERFERVRMKLPGIAEKDPEAAEYLRKALREKEQAYQRMLKGEAKKQKAQAREEEKITWPELEEAAPPIAPEIAPEPKRRPEVREAAMPPPAEPEKVLIEDWKNWDIRSLAREVAERRKQLNLILDETKNLNYLHNYVEPLENELGRRTGGDVVKGGAYFWASDALRWCEEARATAHPDIYRMQKAIKTAEACLRHAGDCREGMPASDAQALTFVEELIEKARDEYQRVEAEFEDRKALYPEVKLPPVEALGKRRFDLGQMWEGLRKRFKVGVDLRIGERLKALGKPLSSEEAEAALATQKAAAEARKETLRKIWEKGVAILPSVAAVKDWVDGVWAKASAPLARPLTEEEMEAGLEAQKVRFEIPQFIKGISFQEALEKVKTDPKARRRVLAIGGGVLAAAGASLVAYEIVLRHGQDIQFITTHLTPGIEEATKELLAKVSPTVTATKEAIAKVLPTATPTPPATPVPPVTLIPTVTPEAVEVVKEVVEKGAEIVKEVVTKPEIVTKPEVIKEAVKEVAKAPWDMESLRHIVREAVAAKAQVVQTATEQVRQAIQTGIEIAKGSHSWGAAETAAKQVIEAAGVQSDPERLSILTDAINKAGGLPDLVQPGTKLMLKPESIADTLAKAIEKTSQVIAHGGAEGLKVPADQEDLQVLTRVVEFLKAFK